MTAATTGCTPSATSSGVRTDPPDRHFARRSPAAISKVELANIEDSAVVCDSVHFTRPTPVVMAALLALTTVDLGSRTAQSDTPLKDARVEGRVLAADTGLPIPDATVRLVGGPSSRATPADEHGHFELSGVVPGRYLLSAVTAGYAIGTFGQRNPADAPLSIELRAGVTRTQADIRLTPLGTLSGRIVNEQGDPLSGVQMQAVRRAIAIGNQIRGRVAPPISSSTTDRNGEYRIRDLTPGNYQVIAIPTANLKGTSARGSTANPDATARQPVPTFYPGVAVPAEALTVRVDLGADTLVNFDVRQARPSTISGTVLDSQGRPGRDYLVVLQHTSVQLPIAQAAQSFSEVGHDGRFVFPGVLPGDYRADVRSKSGYEALAKTGGIGTLRDSSLEFANVPVHVTGDDIEDMTVRTGPGFALTGHVAWKGAIPPPASRAIFVSARSVSNTSGLLSDSTSPRADGWFRLEKLLGTLTIRVSQLPAGYALRSVSVEGVDVTDEGVEVTRDLLDVEVVIGPETQITERVTDGSGVPIPGASVIVFAEDRRRWSMPATRSVGSTLAGSDGTFSISGLPAARYYGIALPAIVEGKLVEPDDLQPLESKATGFSLSDGQRRVLTLRIE